MSKNASEMTRKYASKSRGVAVSVEKESVAKATLRIREHVGAGSSGEIDAECGLPSSILLGRYQYRPGLAHLQKTWERRGYERGQGKDSLGSLSACNGCNEPDRTGTVFC